MNDEHSDPQKDTSPAQNAGSSECKDLQAERDGPPAFHDLPVVGLGASAGGLEALKAFFSNVPPRSGMTYIIMMHLAPNQPSMLPDLLQKMTDISVSMAEDGQNLQPDHAYVVPPKKEASVYNGAIQLLDPVDTEVSLPIDFFFRTLAADRKARAAAVILSGTGSDGTVGLKEIKNYEGLVLVQSEESAKYNGMPRSAIATGLVDMILDPQDMPDKLIAYFGLSGQAKIREPEISENQEWLSKIFSLLRVQTGQDFSFYKTNTIQRRISRRMVLNQIEDHEAYLSFLRQNSRELKALFQELLIGVTNFFRDPESFEVLKKKVLPDVFSRLKDDTNFRVWVPGCSSGEEVYSLAMVILECLDDFPGKKITLQMFGTDIDRQAIDKARIGLYPSSIKADVSQERLNRFFHSEGEAFRIRKEVRDTVVFSVQDVLKDAPFSRLNLLSCRNLLIYLNSEAQKKLIPIFHYTLVPEGIMMLGSSETIGSFNNLFKTLSSTWKIYKRREVPQNMLHRIEFPTGRPDIHPAAKPQSEDLPQPKVNLETLTKNLVLDRFAPPAALIDSRGTILNIQGRTGKYLEPASGPPNQNILDMAREGLRMELSMALRKAVSTHEQIIRHQVLVQVNGGTQPIDLHVLPIDKPKELSGRFLVVFQDIDLPSQETELSADKPKTAGAGEYETRISELEQELQETRENHQSTVEELESSNEELKSTNEELQSSNEELQSTNEELESSKEELQSLNEELQTVNSELQSKVDELSAAHDDINNLLNSTEIATVFVDNNVHVKRFSRAATNIIHLIESDIGRPLAHQATRIRSEDIVQDIRHVLDQLSPVEKEVCTVDAHWYIMRIIPYRTQDNRIQGAVLTFRDVDELKKSQQKLREAIVQQEQAWYLTRRVFDMHQIPLAVVDDQGRVDIANSALGNLLEMPVHDMEGKDVFSLDNLDKKGTELRDKLRTALDAGKDFVTSPLSLDTSGGEKSFAIQGNIVCRDGEQRPYRILLRFQEK